MALRISVDLDGLRWADLFRFVDLARSGGIGADDQVDVITYGSDPMSVSLSARIYPASDSFLAMDSDAGSGDSLARVGAPLAVNPPGSSSSNGSPFGYDAPADRGASPNGSHYPPFENSERSPGASGGGLPTYAQPSYDHGTERPGAAAANGAHYPSFDGQSERLPAAPSQFASFETVYDRNQAAAKEPAGQGGGGVDSPYVEEFARLQEGLMRQVRRGDEGRPDRP